MKIARFIVFSLFIVLLGSCMDPWNNDGKGTFSIAWGNAKARSFVNAEDLKEFEFSVLLTGVGHPQEFSFKGVSARFKVDPGFYTITVQGYSPGTAAGGFLPVLEVMGIEQIRVNPGANGTKIINMYTATVIKNWIDLTEHIKNYSDYYEETPQEELIILEEISPGSWVMNNTINITRPITFIAEDEITITRGAVGGSFFNVLGLLDPPTRGHLTLGLPGMKGKITLEGNLTAGYFPTNDALITVGTQFSGADFVMNEGITLSGNTAGLPPSDFKNGGGVFLKNGTFTMNGGEITGNTATGIGGGVDVEYGIFTMNGGEIYENIADNEGGGVSITRGTFNMNGGSITRNTATNGGGLYVPGRFVTEPIVFFNKNGGDISGNNPGDIYPGF